MKHWIPALFFAALALVGQSFFNSPAAPKRLLSEYGFFNGPLSALQASAGVQAYEVNAPLFSDYAEKARFIYLPPGTAMEYREKTSFEFPEGAVLIKNFYYFQEAAHPEKGRRILETRLLIREKTDWKALTYRWNEAQTDAELEVAGATVPVSFKNTEGKNQQLDYILPNLNQCKGCHSYAGAFTPIGVTARQLNRPAAGADNQLTAWIKQGILNAPADFDVSKAPLMPNYLHESEGSLDARARAYLDANCAHCHNPKGPASTSGMFLEYDREDRAAMGVMKAPIAAGRGSGNRKYGILPGKPQESILLYRMEQNDPGIRMPELGRQLAHREGIELIRTWIKQMK